MKEKQRAICLDFEGTLVGEFWPAVADKYQLEELRITTQDFPDFALLTEKRIGILNEHNISLQDLVEVAETIEPLDGAVEFIARLRKSVNRICIVSDFAEQLAAPMLEKFGGLCFFGNRFVADENSKVTGYDYRQEDQKPYVVAGLQSMNYEVYAAGDSYNDISMLTSADKGILFKSNEKIQSEYPQFETATIYEDLYELLTKGIQQ